MIFFASLNVILWLNESETRFCSHSDQNHKEIIKNTHTKKNWGKSNMKTIILQIKEERIKR